jgi:diacylglycerol kinase (ATP)
VIHVIINPISGAGADPIAAKRRAELVAAAARARGAEVTIDFTARAGHAAELGARAVACGADAVIIWGGDGTFNEAASALIGTGIPVGLVPAGSGNGLARALGVPWDPAAALARAFGGVPTAIDAGRMAGRCFFNIAGIGFDARVAALFNRRAKGTRGGWPYIVIGVREGCRYCSLEYDVGLDGEMHHYRALIIAFANGREYGLGARIAPDARLDDGLLDAIIVEERGVVARFWDARHLAKGTAHLAPLVTTRRVRRATIESPGEMEFHVDGEPGVASDPLERWQVRRQVADDDRELAGEDQQADGDDEPARDQLDGAVVRRMRAEAARKRSMATAVSRNGTPRPSEYTVSSRTPSQTVSFDAASAACRRGSGRCRGSSRRRTRSRRARRRAARPACAAGVHALFDSRKPIRNTPIMCRPRTMRSTPAIFSRIGRRVSRNLPTALARPERDEHHREADDEEQRRHEHAARERRPARGPRPASRRATRPR